MNGSQVVGCEPMSLLPGVKCKIKDLVTVTSPSSAKARIVSSRCAVMPGAFGLPDLFLVFLSMCSALSCSPSAVFIATHLYSRVFCDGMPFRKLFFRRTQAKMAFQNLFPCIGIMRLCTLPSYCSSF